mmetsp:Transcript_55638/g.148346  ORF Transcript_55638/g.148346 Transcript_55638/m.148346 type:complete len:475 (-) Transcript_55638:15-1439(-)
MIAWAPGAGGAGDARATEFHDCTSDPGSSPEVVAESHWPSLAGWCAPRADCRTAERTLRTPSDSGNSWNRVVCRAQQVESCRHRSLGGFARKAAISKIGDHVANGGCSQASSADFAMSQQRLGSPAVFPGQCREERTSSSSCDRHTVASYETSEPSLDDGHSGCLATTSSVSSAKNPSAALTKSDRCSPFSGCGILGSGPGELETIASGLRLALAQQLSEEQKDTHLHLTGGCKPFGCGTVETVPSTITPGGLVLGMKIEGRTSLSARDSGRYQSWSSGTGLRRSASGGTGVHHSRRSCNASDWSARPSSRLSSRFSSVVLMARRRQTAADMPADEESGADTSQSSLLEELPIGSPAARVCSRPFPGSDESSCFDSQTSSVVGEGQLSPGLAVGGERLVGSRRIVLIDWDDGGDDCSRTPSGSGVARVSSGSSLDRSPATWARSAGACPSPVVIDVNQSSELGAALERRGLDVA